MLHKTLQDKIRSVNKKNNLVFFEYDPVTNEKIHKYLLNGKRIKYSASKVVNIENFDFSNIPDIKFYADVGTDLHMVVEKVSLKEDWKNQKFETFAGEMIAPVVAENWQKVLDKWNCEEICAEEILTNGFVAGKFDFMAIREGKIWLCDFKTSKSLTNGHKLQLNIYKTLLKEEYNINVDYMCLIKIDKETGKLTPQVIGEKPANIIQSLITKGFIDEEEKDELKRTPSCRVVFKRSKTAPTRTKYKSKFGIQ